METLKICPSCREPKPLSEFNSQKKYCLVCHREKGKLWRIEHADKASEANRKYHAKVSGLQKTKENQRKHSKAHYAKNSAKYIERNQKNRARLLSFIREYKHDKCCSRCGFSDYRCLEFHHLRDKKFNIADVGQINMSMAKLLKEIAKCELICANCHAIEHFTGEEK